MDYDEVSNISSQPNNEPVTPSRSRNELPQEIIFAVFSLTGIASNVLILTTIIKYKRLRTVPLIFVANWAFADLCALTATLSFYRLIGVWENISIPIEIVCILLNIGRILHITVHLFAVMLVVHWALEVYYVRWYDCMEWNYKYVLWFVWGITLLHAIIDWGMCVHDNSLFNGITSLSILITFSLSALLSLIFQVTRAVKKCQGYPLPSSPFMLNLVTAFIGCLFLGVLCALCNVFFTHIFTLIIAACLMSNSSVNFCMLYFRHQEFQACFRELIKCRSKQYDESDLINDTTTSEVVTLPKLNNQQESRVTH